MATSSGFDVAAAASRARWSTAVAREVLAAWSVSGLSRREFAEKHGLQEQRLCNWERRLAEPDTTAGVQFREVTMAAAGVDSRLEVFCQAARCSASRRAYARRPPPRPRPTASLPAVIARPEPSAWLHRGTAFLPCASFSPLNAAPSGVCRAVATSRPQAPSPSGMSGFAAPAHCSCCPMPRA
jgi:hypothetical protein